MGLEGIVSERRGSVYRSGRNPNWRKTKCTTMDVFAVTGAKPAHGSVRSLKLARLVSGILTPCGWVGSGFTEREGIKLREAIDAKRALIAQVEHRGVTPAGSCVIRCCEAGARGRPRASALPSLPLTSFCVGHPL
jgi:bifunctional non-homologous end joining protein LigD